MYDSIAQTRPDEAMAVIVMLSMKMMTTMSMATLRMILRVTAKTVVI